MWEERFYELARAASHQLGLITAAQAGRLGVEAETLVHLKQKNLLREVDTDVFQLAGSTAEPLSVYSLASWLMISPELFRWERPKARHEDAVLSHESACRLLGLGAVSAPHTVFTVPSERRAPRATRIHVATLAADDVMIHMGIPVTNPRRTLIDVIRDWVDRDQVRRAITDAVQRDVVDLKALYDELVPMAAECQFPVGPDFVDYWLEYLALKTLGPRNLRGYAAIVAGDEVAEVQRRLTPVLAEARTVTGSPNAGRSMPRDEKITWDLAAEMVATIESIDRKVL